MLFSILQACCLLSRSNGFLPTFLPNIPDLCRLRLKVEMWTFISLASKNFFRTPAVCFGFLHSSRASRLAALSVIFLSLPLPSRVLVCPRFFCFWIMAFTFGTDIPKPLELFFYNPLQLYESLPISF